MTDDGFSASWSTQTVPGDPATWSQVPVERVRRHVHLAETFGRGALVGAALVLLRKRVSEKRHEPGEFLRCVHAANVGRTAVG